MGRRVHEVDDQVQARIEYVLEEFLPEAFATGEVATRRLMRRDIVLTGTPCDVHLVGGIALHGGWGGGMYNEFGFKWLRVPRASPQRAPVPGELAG